MKTNRITVTKTNTGSPDQQSHYKGLVEPIELMQTLLSPAEFLGFLKGNALKYACRAGRKAGEGEDKDMTKCKVYNDWAQEFMKTGTITIHR